MLGSNSIKNRILATLNEKLDALQAGYDAECKRLEEKTRKEKAELDEKLKGDKVSLADKLVNSIISKVI